MAANRISRFVDRMNAPLMPSPSDDQRPAAPPAIPPGFAVCPLHVAVAQAWQQEIYRQAYEQAVARTQVPRHYRRMFPTWN